MTSGVVDEAVLGLLDAVFLPFFVPIFRALPEFLDPFLAIFLAALVEDFPSYARKLPKPSAIVLSLTVVDFFNIWSIGQLTNFRKL